MERRLTILFSILLYFILCGKSCVKEPAQDFRRIKEVETAKDSIRIEFEADYLSEEARVAAEMTAIQKLADLADYMKIYTDASMDTLFREKAGEMIRGIFFTEDARLAMGTTRNKKMKSITMGEFMKEGFGKDFIYTEVIFDSIRVMEPLQKSGELEYTGKLSANQAIISYTDSDSVFSPSIPVTIEIISSRRIKIIGNDTLMVWTVSLGDMD